MHAKTLSETPLVALTDVHCRPESPHCGAEECTATHRLVFPRSGVFVKHVRGERVVADANHVIFFNACEPYRVSHPVPGGDDCMVLSFADELLIEALGSGEGADGGGAVPPFARTHGLLDPHRLLVGRRLRHRAKAGTASALELEETALTLLHGIAMAPAEREVGQRRRHREASARLGRERVEATKLLVAGRPESDLGLGEIARAVASSPYHLARHFRASVGLPIHQYRLRMRLALALERMLDGRGNLLALALDLGFAGHSHFAAAFKQAFGVTPSAFRRSASARRVREMRKNLTV
ncbi:MAG: helix-turn-helix transcriptional regulator [Alphaproteobacteria bacterium]